MSSRGLPFAAGLMMLSLAAFPGAASGAEGSDEEQLRKLYEDTYAAMIKKDEKALNALHDDSFVLVHMTGMHQNKRQYISYIMNGTLNYYSAKTESLDIKVDGDTAVMTGHSLVNAAVFGGGRHTWHLELVFTAAKKDGVWRLTRSEAGTY